MKDNMKQFIRLNAGNDDNGNPRRVFIVLENNIVLAAIDEGYKGLDALPKELQALASTTATFNVPPYEYKDVLKEFPNSL